MKGISGMFAAFLWYKILITQKERIVFDLCLVNWPVEHCRGLSDNRWCNFAVVLHCSTDLFKHCVGPALYKWQAFTPIEHQVCQ